MGKNNVVDDSFILRRIIQWKKKSKEDNLIKGKMQLGYSGRIE